MKATLLALLAGAGAQDGQSEPDYPLGELRVPPIADAADPFRLVDLRYAFSDGGGNISSFETRVRIGASSFLGGEVTGGRRGLFFDTQRVELGLTEQDGRYEIEGSYRAPWFLVGVRGFRGRNDWRLDTSGSVRLSNDIELLVDYGHDFDDSRFTPGTVEEFAASSELPEPAPPAREISSISAGFLYQRGNQLELLGEARKSKRRTETSFDLDVENYRVTSIVQRDWFALDGSVAFEKTSGRLSSTEGRATLGTDLALGAHLLVRAETEQRWEPGVLRFEERYRAGLTFFGRRHRFFRATEAADRLLALQKEANELGYNERRAYDVDGIRRFRERLGISPARAELSAELHELYEAQVRARNVPQLGFTFELAEDALAGMESRSYRLFVGVPWKVRWPFSRSEDSVEFLTAELDVREDNYSGGVRSLSYELAVAVFLNREMSLRFSWERPGITPEEIAREASRPARFTVSYDYAMGR